MVPPIVAALAPLATQAVAKYGPKVLEQVAETAIQALEKKKKKKKKQKQPAQTKQEQKRPAKTKPSKRSKPPIPPVKQIETVWKSLPKKVRDANRKHLRQIVKYSVNEEQPTGGGDATIQMKQGTTVLSHGADAVAVGSTIRDAFGVSPMRSDPLSKHTNDGVVADGVEYLGVVTTPATSKQGQTLFTLSFNPLEWFSTRLSQFAQLYEYFRFVSVEMIYVPVVSKMTDGAIMMGIQGNVSKNLPADTAAGLRSAMELKDSEMTQVYENQSLTYKFTVPTQPYLCVPSPPSDNIASTLSNQGIFFVKDASGLVGNKTYGNIVCKYKIAFYNSQYNPSSVNAPIVATATVNPNGTGPYLWNLISITPPLDTNFSGERTWVLMFGTNVGDLFQAYTPYWIQQLNTQATTTGGIYASYTNLLSRSPMQTSTTAGPFLSVPIILRLWSVGDAYLMEDAQGFRKLHSGLSVRQEIEAIQNAQRQGLESESEEEEEEEDDEEKEEDASEVNDKDPPKDKTEAMLPPVIRQGDVTLVMESRFPPSYKPLAFASAERKDSASKITPL